MTRSKATLRKHCEKIAATLPIPKPFVIERFIESLSEHCERRIELVEMHVRSDTPCGLLVNTKEADYIFYATNTTALHRKHIVAHEAGHLLFDHEGTIAQHDTVHNLLLKNLSAKLIVRVLGRTAYSEEQEVEAEMLASVILMRAGVPHAEESNHELAGGLENLRSIFG